MKTLGWIVASCLMVSGLGCEFGPRSGRGFRLPDGDLERGAVAFAELGCGACHDVVGAKTPVPGERAEVVVTLGGRVSRIETYGELVTSIINPSHEISNRYDKEQLADGDVSKMTNFNAQMTVAQLIDLTAFLQSKYQLEPGTLYLP